jgi:hypothetical protein
MTEQYRRTQLPPEQDKSEVVELFPGNYSLASDYISKFYEAYMGKAIVRSQFKDAIEYDPFDIFNFGSFKINTIFNPGREGFAFYMLVKDKQTKSVILCKNPTMGSHHAIRGAEENLLLETSTVTMGTFNLNSGTIEYENRSLSEGGISESSVLQSNMARLYSEFLSFEPTRARFQQ